MWTGLYLAIGGLVIGIGAFVFALINLVRHGSNLDSLDWRSLFMGHIGAMVVMVLGGLIFFIGAVIALVNVFIELTGILNSGLL